MLRSILLVTLCIFHTKVRAEREIITGTSRTYYEDCTFTDTSATTCVPVFACVGEQGVYFTGQAYGWSDGAVTGHLSTGETCTGTWSKNGLFGTGYSNLSCTNGTNANIVYHYQDQASGTIFGRGNTYDGRRVDVWTGRFILDYLKKSGVLTLPCAQGEIPMV